MVCAMHHYLFVHAHEFSSVLSSFFQSWPHLYTLDSSTFDGLTSATTASFPCELLYQL